MIVALALLFGSAFPWGDAAAGDVTSCNIVPGPDPGGGDSVLFDVAGTETDAWTVGWGTAYPSYFPQTLHWNGAEWALVPNGVSTGALYDVEAISSSDVWAVGGDFSAQALAMHWDGASWTVVPTPSAEGFPSLYGIAAIDPSDIWAVGSTQGTGNRVRPSTTRESRTSVYTTYAPLAMHWDGASWTVVPTPPLGDFGTLYDAAAVSTDDVWAVGSSTDEAVILHWDGEAWSIAATRERAAVYGVDALDAHDVWGVGSALTSTLVGPLAEHWNGYEWSVTPTPLGKAPYYLLEDVDAFSPGNGWTGGSFATPAPIRSLTLLERWNGTRWTRVPTPNADSRYNVIIGVEAVSGTQLWAVGDYYDQTLRLQQNLIINCAVESSA